MLVKIDGVWINPDHVSRLSVDEDRTLIYLDSGRFVYSSLPPDEVAAILNRAGYGEPDHADE